MSFVKVKAEGNVAVVTLARGKVNAINDPMIDEIADSFEQLEKDPVIRTLVLTGQGKFFSFGFDIPELLEFSRDGFTRFLTRFTDLYRTLFLFPKPVVAALNGHTIAGGCMLASACDSRLMVSGKSKISLNEITFGAAVLAGSVEMLRFCVGDANAQTILYSGELYTGDRAAELGLVDRVIPESELMSRSIETAGRLGEKDSAAFAGIKRLLREPVATVMADRESDSIRKFVEIWYSESTRRQLKEIKIH